MVQHPEDLESVFKLQFKTLEKLFSMQKSEYNKRGAILFDLKCCVFGDFSLFLAKFRKSPYFSPKSPFLAKKTRISARVWPEDD